MGVHCYHRRLDLLDARVVAAANPLRGLAADAAAVSDLVRSIEGPVVLVAQITGLIALPAPINVPLLLIVVNRPWLSKA